MKDLDFKNQTDCGKCLVPRTNSMNGLKQLQHGTGELTVSDKP